MMKIIIICFLATVAISQYAKAQNEDWCAEPWASKEYPYTFCHPETGKLIQRCSSNPYNETIDRLSGSIDLPPFKNNLNCWTYDDSEGFPFPKSIRAREKFVEGEYQDVIIYDPKRVPSIIQDAIDSWKSACKTNTNLPTGIGEECCLDIRWEWDADEFSPASGNDAQTFAYYIVPKRTKNPNNPCEVDCDSYKMVLNNTAPFLCLGKDDNTPRRSFVTEQNITVLRSSYEGEDQYSKDHVKNSVSLASTLRHELGHALGIPHVRIKTENGSHKECEDYEDVLMFESFPTGFEIMQGNHDKAMYAKLYCCDISTSIENKYYSAVRFTIAPNPVSDIMTIQLSNTEQELTQYLLRIVDINGRDVLIKPLSFGSSWSVDVSSLPVGVYIVGMVNKSGDNFSTKVLIER
jgi:hypothetical protein